MEKVYTDEFGNTHKIAPVSSDAKLANVNHELDGAPGFYGSIIDIIAHVVSNNSAWPSYALTAFNILSHNQPNTTAKNAFAVGFGEVTQMDIAQYQPDIVDDCPCDALMKDAKAHMTKKTIDDLRAYLNQSAYNLEQAGQFDTRKDLALEN